MNDGLVRHVSNSWLVGLAATQETMHAKHPWVKLKG